MVKAVHNEQQSIISELVANGCPASLAGATTEGRVTQADVMLLVETSILSSKAYMMPVWHRLGSARPHGVDIAHPRSAMGIVVAEQTADCTRVKV